MGTPSVLQVIFITPMSPCTTLNSTDLDAGIHCCTNHNNYI